MNEQQIEELADLIGPISTRKDRIKRIREFFSRTELEVYTDEGMNSIDLTVPRKEWPPQIDSVQGVRDYIERTSTGKNFP